MEELYEKLNKNISELNIIENEIASVQLEIYQREIESLKEDKLKDLIKYFSNQAKIYNQKEEKHTKYIEKNINKYEEQIEKIITAYNMLYIKVFSFMQNARNNQKIALANVVTLTNSENNENKELAIACAQKKLNYAVIIDECKARLDWCLENIKNDINEVFINETNTMVVYKENIWNKFINRLMNKINGKSKFVNLLETYEKVELKNIQINVNYKILNVGAVLNGVTKQMNIAKEQIALQYEQSIRK